MVGNTQVNKVIIITRANYPIGSWSNRVRKIANGIIKNNVQCEVLVTYPWPKLKNIEDSEEFVNYITKPRKKSESITSIFHQLYSLHKLRLHLNKMENKPDIIILTGDRYLDTHIVSDYCLKNNVKLYLDIVDEVGRAFDKSKKTIYSRLAIWNRKRFNNLLHRIDRIYVLSSQLERKYISLTQNKEKVIRSTPTFIDEENFNNLAKNFDIGTVYPEVNKTAKVIIAYAGSCARTNGLFFFLNALSRIENIKSLGVKVFFVFHIGNIDNVRDYVSNLGLNEIVKIFGETNPQYIPSFYSKADILVLPEHGKEVANAGFPGKTGEYLVSGKSILSTDFSDLADYLVNRYNCMLSEIGDINTYVGNLKELISDKELREKLGKNAKDTARSNFDYRKASLKYLKMD
jgi:glycosyltransferase involved in cell wall biosynthesis